MRKDLSLSFFTRHYYSISSLDLPRAVKFKPRKQKSPDYVPKGLKNGRSFEDFLLFMEENPSAVYAEMDTVIGRTGGKVIMTFQFVNVDFMFGILPDNKTAAEAGNKIIQLKERLRNAGFCFGTVFPTILTDNGGEFTNVFAFENNSVSQAAEAFTKVNSTIPEFSLGNHFLRLVSVRLFCHFALMSLLYEP